MPRRVLHVTIAVALASCASVPPPPAWPGDDGPAAVGAGPTPEPTAAGARTFPAPAADLHASAADPAREAHPAPPPSTVLEDRLAARAKTFLGRKGPFRAGGERFNPDCSGYVEAVYEAEGVKLRELMQQVAPGERFSVKAAWLAARAHGRTFGAEAAPAPGNLVFWHGTYDRRRARRADDRFTHVGIVEAVKDGTVHFLHRGGRGVTRGVMTLERSHEARDEEGRPLNSAMRARSRGAPRGGRGFLAAELFAGFGRFDPARLPGEYRRTVVARSAR